MHTRSNPDILKYWIQKSTSTFSRSKTVIDKQPLYNLCACLTSELGHLTYFTFDHCEIFGSLGQRHMRRMTLSCKNSVLTQSSRLLVSYHMQSETPFQSSLIPSSIFKIIHQIVQRLSTLPCLDTVSKDLAIVQLKQ